jgi:predicted amino acid racemase
MAPHARITVDLARIEANAHTLATRLTKIAIVGVTKVTCGSPEVARALLAGGAQAIGESRLENAERLRAAGIAAPIWLLRSPPPAAAADAVRLCDISLNSELETVKALDAAAAQAGRVHGVMAMVDLGDLREGVMPGDLMSFVEACDALSNIRVEGVGVNLTCYGAIMPTTENLGELAQLAEQAQRLLGRPLLVSGGNSSSLDLALAGEMPPAVNTLRIGESILLGLNTLTREPLIDLHVDAFTIWAPVI